MPFRFSPTFSSAQMSSLARILAVILFYCLLSTVFFHLYNLNVVSGKQKDGNLPSNQSFWDKTGKLYHLNKTHDYLQSLTLKGWNGCQFLSLPLEDGEWHGETCLCVNCPNDHSCGGLWHANRFPFLRGGNIDKKKLFIVVSHCMSELHWLSNFTHGYKISSTHILSKCGRTVIGAPRDAIIQELPNVGRCDHSYAYYISNVLDKIHGDENTKNLIIFFLKDDMSGTNIHQRGSWVNFETMLRIASSINGFACGMNENIASQFNDDSFSAFHDRDSLFGFHIEKYDRNIKGYRNNSVHFKSNFSDFGSFFGSLDLRLNPELIQVCYGGVFAASFTNIQKVSKSIWKKIETTLSRGDNIQEGHYMERAWALLLATPDLKKYQIDALRKFSASETAPFPYTGALISRSAQIFQRCWNDLPKNHKIAGEFLGFSEDTWNHDMWPPGMYPRHWNALQPKQRNALISLGYTKRIWENLVYKHFQCTFSRKKERRKVSHSLARIFIFHEDSGYQLGAFLKYYSHVISLRHIVIIEHKQTRVNKDNKIDVGIIQKVGNEQSKPLSGVDTWQCYGDAKYKGDMWSHVIHYYAPYTDFVFPINLNDYISIQKCKKKRGNVTKSLTWNRLEFVNALGILEKETGRPFKMQHIKVGSLDEANTKISCEKKSLVEKVLCSGKAFMKGKDFQGTDADNVYGGNNVLKSMCLSSEENILHDIDSKRFSTFISIRVTNDTSVKSQF